MNVYIILSLVICCSSLALKAQEHKIEFIAIKIKNNSVNRNHFYVVGPKSNSTKFSYGFPMMPNSKRDEYWSVGTKIYQQKGLGFKTLLIKIKPSDKGKVINLFK